MSDKPRTSLQLSGCCLGALYTCSSVESVTAQTDRRLVSGVGSLHIPHTHACTHAHTHTHTIFPGLPGSACTRKVKSIWILLKQETVSGSGISWAICKSAPSSLQTDYHASTPPLSFLQDGCPSCGPTNSVKALKACAYQIIRKQGYRIALYYYYYYSRLTASFTGQPE